MRDRRVNTWLFRLFAVIVIILIALTAFLIATVRADELTERIEKIQVEQAQRTQREPVEIELQGPDESGGTTTIIVRVVNQVVRIKEIKPLPITRKEIHAETTNISR